MADKTPAEEIADSMVNALGYTRADIEITPTVLCANEDHDEETPAVARLSWPDGRYKPTTACLDDLLWHVEDSYSEGHPARVEPIITREVSLNG